MELAKRDDVPVELTWDLSLIYPTEEAMLADAQKMKELSLSMEASYKGNLTDAATINHCLDDYQEVYRLITLTANYCDLAVSVDYYNSANQTRNDRINSLISEIFSRLTFIERAFRTVRECFERGHAAVRYEPLLSHRDSPQQGTPPESGNRACHFRSVPDLLGSVPDLQHGKACRYEI